MIPYGRQEITEADLAAVQAVLQSDWLTQGPAVPAFEAAVARRVGAAHAVAVNSATSALHLACLALDLGPGDRLWTSPITFVASANCARYCGAEVDFVDIDPHTRNLCPQALAEKLRIAEGQGRLPKIVVAVHFGGLACDMPALKALAGRYGFRLIEDASHAIGASVAGVPVGAGQASDITVFSFHPVKIITTGEGGMALTNQPELARRMACLRSHGITREAVEMEAAFRSEGDGPWYYQQIELGFNYRMTDLQAALGLSQLDRLDDYIARREQLAAAYDQALATLPLVLPARLPGYQSAWHLYLVALSDAAGCDRLNLFNALREAGIGVNVHYIPVHLQPYYRRLGFAPGQYPQAENYYSRALTLPLYPTLGSDDQMQVVSALNAELAT